MSLRLTALSVAALSFAMGAHAEKTMLSGGNIIDVRTGNVMTGNSILIEDGRIVAHHRQGEDRNQDVDENIRQRIFRWRLVLGGRHDLKPGSDERGQPFGGFLPEDGAGSATPGRFFPAFGCYW